MNRAKLFPAYCKSANLPEPVEEYEFHDSRKWRFDFAWPVYKIALEVEGGVWSNGRHVRGRGFMGDVDKYNAATLMGWRVLRCTPQTLFKHETLQMIKSLLTTIHDEKD